MVMSWHWLVTEVVWVPSPWLPPFQRPSMAPDWVSVKMRGSTRFLLFGVLEDLDDVDAEEGGVGVLIGGFAGAAASSSAGGWAPVPEM
jgi:hypothetical protein